jgi:hypothetical protein
MYEVIKQFEFYGDDEKKFKDGRIILKKGKKVNIIEMNNRDVVIEFKYKKLTIKKTLPISFSKQLQEVGLVYRLGENQETNATADVKEEMTTEVSAEQKLVVISCKNDEFKTALCELANKMGIEIVEVSQNAVEDIVATRELQAKNASEKEKQELEDKIKFRQYITSEVNRRNAEEHAAKLYAILTSVFLGKKHDLNGKIEIDSQHEEMEWKTSELVKASNLTHKTADELLSMLFLFGMIEYTKGKHMFKFRFMPRLIHQNIEQAICAQVALLNHDIQRFHASLNADKNLSIADRVNAKKAVEDMVNEKIEFPA